MKRRGRFQPNRFPAICAVIAVVVTLPPVLGAETEFEVAPPELNPGFVGKKKKPWEEQAVSLPAYPGSEAANRVTIPVVGTQYAYTLELEALSSDADGVVRYSIAITSPAGASNVLYEGVRCKTAEYKTYAYGNQGAWSEAVYPAWRRITRGAGLEFRRVLFQDHFCDEMYEPYDRERIVASLKQSDRSRR